MAKMMIDGESITMMKCDTWQRWSALKNFWMSTSACGFDDYNPKGGLMLMEDKASAQNTNDRDRSVKAILRGATHTDVAAYLAYR